MKISSTTLLWVISFHVIKACNVGMPNIMLAVQFAGRGALGSQQSTEFIVPLYSGCDYTSPADPVNADGGSVPTTAVAANFPGDGFGFTGSDGLLLNSDALDKFLHTLSSTTGASVDVNAALSLVVCTVTGSDGTKYRFNDAGTHVFEGGAPISVASYQCAVVLGA